ncbi:tryptophan--tRNA ligase [Frateuria aurantia]
MAKRVLTGITTTGIPHLGNYVGAIRPAIAASREAGVDAFYFMADYHALIKAGDPKRVAESRQALAATWLAAGLDHEKVTFYRQSDVPEIPELCWLLTCVTAKGLLNRAHAYKASVDQNTAAGEDPDAGITAGLYMYPVLMAADILAFDAHWVPVGRDQIQHIEMARDIAQRFNHRYGGDHFVQPEALIEEHSAILPGLDGRKMSKSYDNTIPLFEGGSRGLKESISRIVTDSRGPGEAKDPDSTSLTMIYRSFASDTQYGEFRQALEQGLAWGEAKQQLFARVEAEIGPMRDAYEDLQAHPERVEAILQDGARKARALAVPKLAALREAVGLGRASAMAARPVAKPKGDKSARLASFRDDLGQFRFRLFAADGRELLLSVPFADPKQAGQAQAALRTPSAAVELVNAGDHVELKLNGEVLAHSSSHPDVEAVSSLEFGIRQALDQLQAG